MATKLENNNYFTPDECGVLGSTFTTGKPMFFGIQKSSINSADGFCYSPYGQVSNIDCPDWDPGCNCYITQYRPTSKMVTDSELFTLKQSINECDKIKELLPNTPEGKNPSVSDWWGIDFNNPKSCFNCAFKELDNQDDPKAKFYEIISLGITGIADSEDPAARYPYSMAFPGISGPVILSKLDPESSSRDDYPGSFTNFNKKINGPLFSHYLEYSKTNATFWNTPEKTPLLRKAQMALYGAQKIKILVNGDYNNVYVGGLVNIEIPIFGEGNGGAGYPSHKRFAGTWLVYRIERFINASKHTMNLFLMRDGLYPYNKPTDINIYKNTTVPSSDSST